jgi:hypothetical protein
LTELLTSQNKLILNSNEIKKAYLQNLKAEKNESRITPQQYYSNSVNTNVNTSANTSTNAENKPSGMFKPVN